MPLKLWIALIVLSLSSFAIVTTELAPIGLLSALAHDLNQSEAITGLIVTGYGWVAAISALCSIVLLIRFPRKMVLMIMLLILAISNIIVAYSSSFNMIFSARIIGAIAHGSFWALIGAVAYSLVPKHKLGLATSIIFSGVSVASILGVPLASYLTQLSSWRLAFEFLGLLSFIVCILILLFVPKIPDQAPLASGFFKKVLQHSTLNRLFILTALIISSHFAAFTFIEPFLSQIAQLESGQITLLLLVFGLAGLIGNILAGKLIDRHLHTIILISLVFISGSVFAFGYLGYHVTLSIAIVFLALWGVSIASIFVGLQTWVLKQADDLASAASAIYVAVFNASIGLGALIGSFMLQYVTLNRAFEIITIFLIISLYLLQKFNRTH
ncbi:MFS transporter [Acinetobacter soli]|uniref:MFS transporter n=1 Tax=Acinetobacter soli TaxID=487316 RepID=UPI00046A418B|nr:MFS transporter [Acinetobacter soli]MCF3126520.1 MFS transporter [Acinetobacter soli]MEB4800391.1 MFS transporter [Acinetobacter soli]RSB58128.1 MFS transporter [Acinetobacter soli]